MTNQVYFGDNLDILKTLESDSVDSIYIVIFSHLMPVVYVVQEELMGKFTAILRGIVIYVVKLQSGNCGSC